MSHRKLGGRYHISRHVRHHRTTTARPCPGPSLCLLGDGFSVPAQISGTKHEFPTHRLRRLGDRNADRMSLDRGIGCGGALPPILFSTHVTSKNSAIRSAQVSVWRLIVVTWLAEWAVFVGSCDRARGSASGVRLLYATGYNILGWPLHGLTCGLPASAAVPCAVVYIRLSYVNKSISVCLALSGRDTPQLLCGCTKA